MMNRANDIFKAEGEFFCRVKCAWQKTNRSGWTLEILDEDMHALGVQFLAAPAGSRWLDELTSAVGRLWAAGDYATQTAVLGGDMRAAVGLTGAVRITRKGEWFNCTPICPAALEASMTATAAADDDEASVASVMARDAARREKIIAELVRSHEWRGVDEPAKQRAWIELLEAAEHIRETADALPACWREVNGRQVQCVFLTARGLRLVHTPRGWQVERRGKVIARQDGCVIEVLDSKMPVPALD